MNILITGGRSDIGQAIIKKCHESGHRVVFTATSESSAKSVAPFSSEMLPWIEMNLNCPEESFGRINEVFPETIDAVVLNAAAETGRYRLLHEYTESETEQILRPNILGHTLLLQFVLRRMVQQQSGKIVFISSLAVDGFYKHSLYGGWKSYMEGLIKSIAIDYGQNGIRANIVRPSLVETKKTAPFWKRSSYKTIMQPLIPSGEFAQPQSVATAVAYFLEKDCYSNGSVLDVSGGLPQIRSDQLFPRVFGGE